jgi:hypothetical protein
MADDEAKLKILIEMGLDDKGAKAAIEAMKQVDAQNKKSSSNTKEAAQHINSMNTALKEFGNSAGKIAVLSAAIGGPLVVATKSYISTMGMAEGTSRSWLGVNYQLEQQLIRVGRVGAKVALPFAEKAAQGAEAAASFAEKNPNVVGGGLAVAGVGAALAGILKLGQMAGSTATAVGNLGQAVVHAVGGAIGGGATGGAAAVGTSMAPIVLATLGAVAMQAGFVTVGNKVMQAFGVKNQTGSPGWIIDKVGQALTEGPEKAGKSALMDIGKSVDGIASATGTKSTLDKLVDAIKGAVAPAPSAGGGGSFTSTQTMAQMRQFQIQEQYAQQDYNRQKFVAQRNLNLQMRYADEDFARTRERSNRDFGMQMVFSDQMMYRQRALAARDFNISMSRNDYDYQLSRKRAAEDHNFSLKQIMLSGDALQYYYAQRQYNIDKQRAEEDYNLQKSRSTEDFQRSQADQLQQFQLERAQQLKEYAIRLNDSLIDFNIQRKRQLEQYAIQLSDMEYQYNLEKQRRWQGFQESIIPEIMSEEKYRAYMMANMNTTMINDFNQLMQKFSSEWQGFIGGSGQQGGTGAPFYDIGGYTKAGPAVVHQGEFVLTAGTTKYAESVAKGNLTQDKLISLMSSKGGLEYNDHRAFYRGLDSTEKQQLQRESKQMVLDAFS